MNESPTFGQKLWRYKSSLALIVANLVPLWEVLFGGWSAFNVVFLFWMENVVIGGFNVLKMLTVAALGDPRPRQGTREELTPQQLENLKEEVQQGATTRERMKLAFQLMQRAKESRVDDAASPPPPLSAGGRVAAIAGMLFLAGFFTVHYGMFCFVHGVFVVSLLNPAAAHAQSGLPNPFVYAGQALAGDLRWAILALVVSHAISFGLNFLKGREYEQVSGDRLMVAPYGRIVVLHLAIIFGAFLSLAFGSAVGILLLMVVGKIMLDLFFHLKERETGTVSLWSKKT